MSKSREEVCYAMASWSLPQKARLDLAFSASARARKPALVCPSEREAAGAEHATRARPRSGPARQCVPFVRHAQADASAVRPGAMPGRLAYNRMEGVMGRSSRLHSTGGFPYEEVSECNSRFMHRQRSTLRDGRSLLLTAARISADREWSMRVAPVGSNRLYRLPNLPLPGLGNGRAPSRALQVDCAAAAHLRPAHRGLHRKNIELFEWNEIQFGAAFACGV